jgi:DNA-binding transcriptional LysR family regulator
MTQTGIEASATHLGRLTLVAPSFVNEVLLPACSFVPGLTVRAVSAPAAVCNQVADSHFDAAITVGAQLDFPSPWSCTPVGELVHGLFASSRLARSLSATPSVDEIRDLRFVAPLYVSSSGELVSDDDGCPLARDQRWITHEVEDVRLACRIAAETDRLVYGPAIAAAPFLRDGSLVEIAIPGWSKTEPVFVACHGERVDPSVEGAMVTTLRKALGSAAAGSIVAPKNKKRSPRTSSRRGAA